MRASVTKAVSVDRHAVDSLPETVRALGISGACQLARRPQHHAGGRRARSHGPSDGRLSTREPIILRETPRLKPRAETARDIAGRWTERRHLADRRRIGRLKRRDKYAAELARRPYVSVATAASMDGYAASGGAMLEGGFKRTLPCAPPVAVFADLDVLAKAPGPWRRGAMAIWRERLSPAAIGPSPDALGEEAIAPEPFGMVQDNIRSWLADPAAVASGSPEALRGLIDGLLISGFAMQAYGNSRPASGSEHQIAHVWEMEQLTVRGEPAAHGACVGIGTIAMLALYEWFLVAGRAGRRECRARGAAAGRPAQREHGGEGGLRRSRPRRCCPAEVAAKMENAGRRERLTAWRAIGPACARGLQSALVAAGTMESSSRPVRRRRASATISTVRSNSWRATTAARVSSVAATRCSIVSMILAGSTGDRRSLRARRILGRSGATSLPAAAGAGGRG